MTAAILNAILKKIKCSIIEAWHYSDSDSTYTPPGKILYKLVLEFICKVDIVVA